MQSNNVGRPKTGQEKSESQKNIKFRESVAARLDGIKMETGVPVATFVKKLVDRALLEYDAGIPIETIMSTEGVGERPPPIKDLHLVSKETTLPNTFTFQVATLIYELFDKMSRRVGYDDPNNLAKDLITRAATNETKALGFLFSDVKAQSEEVAHERAAEMDEALGVKQIKKSAAK